ncbi:CBS domain-containing protein [Candidatus Uhrbacteria bacterium]|nr:CBS domain-containing protein [Candidatus Uhrbacteria bacterium]MBD3284341.1 CBS domain-containing protein [Candidatus Uhrbacteria bacterium]
MRVKDIMETDVITIHKDQTYEDVVKLLHRHNISGCPVVDDGSQLVGIISHKDLLRILYPYYDSFYRAPEMYTDFHQRENKAFEIRHHRVETFMSDPAFTTHPETPMLHAGGKMLAHHVQRLPVILAGELVGIVTRKRILREIFKTNFDL